MIVIYFLELLHNEKKEQINQNTVGIRKDPVSVMVQNDCSNLELIRPCQIFLKLN